MNLESMMRRYYRSFPGFEILYLEDSFVLGIETADTVTFELGAVLLKGHPDYQEPKIGEQHCYVERLLTFPSSKNTEWVRLRVRPVTDPDGTVDYGDIDSFYEEAGVYTLEGDWGCLKITSGQPMLS